MNTLFLCNHFASLFSFLFLTCFGDLLSSKIVISTEITFGRQSTEKFRRKIFLFYLESLVFFHPMIWPPHIVNISSVIEWWNIKHIFKPTPVAARCLRTPASLKLNEVCQEQPWLGRLWCVVFERQHTLEVGPDMTVLRGLHKAIILAKPLKALVV